MASVRRYPCCSLIQTIRSIPERLIYINFYLVKTTNTWLLCASVGGGRERGVIVGAWAAAGAASPLFSTHTYTLDLNNIDGLLESAFFVHW